MSARRSPVIIVAVLGFVVLGCGGDDDAGGSDTTVGTDTTETTETTETTVGTDTTDDPETPVDPGFPPPAEVLEARIVFFDADGTGDGAEEPLAGAIADAAGLAAFEQRYVDGEPPLTDEAGNALASGDVLVGGVISVGCFPAEGAVLGLVQGDVRLIPSGLSAPDPEVACVRAITSVALVAIDPADLPEGATIQGT